MTVTPSSDALQASALYAATFAGRHDAYSIWVPPNGHGDGRWQAIRKPLTGEIVLQSFLTGVPLSGYFLGPNSMTHLAALDLDLETGYELGEQFLKHLRSVGGVGYIEASRRGSHVWMVLSEQRPAIVVRAALRALGFEAGLPRHPEYPDKLDPKVELRPGSDRLGEAKDGEDPPLGHCLRMPTMPHQKTGKRYALISSDGERIRTSLTAMMETVEYCPVDVFDEAALRAPLPKITAPRDLSNPFQQRSDDEDDVSASELLQRLWGASGRLQPGRATKCPAHDDHQPTLLIFRDDRRVLCYSPSCILNNDGHGRGTRELRKLAPGGR